MTFTYSRKKSGKINQIVVQSKVGSVIAHILWNEEEITDLWVHEDFRRKGIARKMYEKAGQPPHSMCRTNNGEAFAVAVGGTIPTRHTLPCNKCGGMEGWEDEEYGYAFEMPRTY